MVTQVQINDWVKINQESDGIAAGRIGRVTNINGKWVTVEFLMGETGSPSDIATRRVSVQLVSKMQGGGMVGAWRRL